MTTVLYNPLANNKKGFENAEKLKENSSLGELNFVDLTKIDDMSKFLTNLQPDEKVILTGGDGTLNRFINAIGDVEISNEIFFFPSGSGNDFVCDVQDKVVDGMVKINDYIKDLPTVEVNGKIYRFINGVGYGIDGYCCEVGDAMQAKSDKPVNYTAIAIKGLLFHFHPANAKVTIDGKTFEYKKVWLAPTMNGRYYGGGMNVAPSQDRLNKERTLSTVVMYGSGKLKTLMVFPNIFKGKHVEYTEMVEIHTGYEMKVEFDRPTALQIDGETIVGVTSYIARSSTKNTQFSADKVATK